MAAFQELVCYVLVSTYNHFLLGETIKTQVWHDLYNDKEDGVFGFIIPCINASHTATSA